MEQKIQKILYVWHFFFHSFGKVEWNGRKMQDDLCAIVLPGDLKGKNDGEYIRWAHNAKSAKKKYIFFSSSQFFRILFWLLFSVNECCHGVDQRDSGWT